MESILEDQRRLFEERERIEEALVKEMMAKKISVSDLNTKLNYVNIIIGFLYQQKHRESINSDHRIKILLDVSNFIKYFVKTSSSLSDNEL